jgi:hypothetical protein
MTKYFRLRQDAEVEILRCAQDDRDFGTTRRLREGKIGHYSSGRGFGLGEDAPAEQRFFPPKARKEEEVFAALGMTEYFLSTQDAKVVILHCACLPQAGSG